MFGLRGHRLPTEAEFVVFSAEEDEAGLLGGTLRGGVVDVTGEVDALQSKLPPPPVDQRDEAAWCEALASKLRRDHVGYVGVVAGGPELE
jgi:hypothetical protein